MAASTHGTTSIGTGHDPVPLPEQKLACLTLDLEDDWSFNDPALDHRTLDHLDDYTTLIDTVDVPVTVFAVGTTIQRFPDAINTLQDELSAAFHLHSHNHQKTYDIEDELAQGIAAFEDHFGERPEGYRAPYGRVTLEDLEALAEHGFAFDSSVFPAYRPGVYRNIQAPREPFRPKHTDLLEFPIGTVPGPRIPVSQSYLNLLGRPYVAAVKRAPLPDMLVIDSHLQDLFKTPCHDALPQPKQFVHKRNLHRAHDTFTGMIQHLKQRGYEFVTMDEAYSRVNEQEGQYHG